MNKEGYFLEFENIKIPIKVKSFASSKTIRLIINEKGCVVTKPKRIPDKQVLTFINHKIEWIYDAYMKSLDKIKKKKAREWISGEELMYLGVDFRMSVEEIKEKRIKISIDEDNKILFISINKDVLIENRKNIIRNAVIKALKNNAHFFIKRKLDYWQKQIGFYCNAFAVREQKTRWGSCNSKGKLNFNYKLIMMPEWVADYIIIHEICHMKHLNHSKDYWNLVLQYAPKHKEAKKWLKQNIHSLELQ